MQTLQLQPEAPGGRPMRVGELYEQAQACLRAGRRAEALGLLEQFLKHRPMNGGAWSLAGQLYADQRDFDNALRCYERAVRLPDGPKEALSGLIRVCLAAGRAEKAVTLLRWALRDSRADETLVLEAAETLEKDGRLSDAHSILLEAQERLATPASIETRTARLHGRRAKLAIFCGGDGMGFFRDILDYLEPRYQVRVFEGDNTQQIRQLMEWSDISWFEWCSNLAVLGTQLPRVCRTVIRLHRYEAYMPWPRQIRWDRVDLLITVGNRFVIEAMESAVPDLRQQTRLIRIPNGVNLGNIPFQRHSRGKSIAFVASMRMVKNPMLLLQCMARLRAADAGYHLHIAGRMDDLLVEQYFRHQVRALGLEAAVHYDGFQQDICGWLADKDYLAVTSVIESQGMGVLEAMAAGIKPVIHNFPGAAENFDPKYLFNTPEEFCGQILSDDYHPEAYREFVERRYPLGRTLMLIDEQLAMLEKKRVAVGQR